MLIIKTRKLYRLIILPILFVVGCNELTAPDPERLGYDYFPLVINEYRTYAVELINYNLNGTTDTILYHMKEVVSNSSLVGEETSYRLDRYQRESESEPWVIDSVWSARLNTYQAIVVENNIPIIKLSFPLTEDRRWDGNAMNTIGYDEFKIKNFGMTYQINGVDYPNSLEMFKEELRDPIGKTVFDYHVEVYSSGIGLIYRLDEDLKFCSDCPEPFTIVQGSIYEQKLLEIGKIE